LRKRVLATALGIPSLLAAQVMLATAATAEPEPPASSANAADDPANALDLEGPEHHMWTNESVPIGASKGGKVEFWPYGDHIYVCDKRADGRHVFAAVYQWDSGRGWTQLFNLTASGNGVCKASHGSMGSVHDLRENGCFLFSIELRDGDNYVQGSYDEAQWANDNERAFNCNPP